VDHEQHRRSFLKLLAIAPLAIATGCSTTTSQQTAYYNPYWRRWGGEWQARSIGPGYPPYGAREAVVDYDLVYAAMDDGGFQLPAIPWRKIDSRYLRRRVPDPTGMPAGTIVVDTAAHLLYLTEGDGAALRYGVGLGREGFEWAGSGEVGRKQEWPRWHPPEEMIAREPELEKYKTTYDRKNDLWLGGMEPGLNNPLGSRAMYVFQNGEDTLYRIHGSPEWNSIGKSVSSGCVRMINQDVIDLYARVSVGTPIVVTSGVSGQFS
jgi:lipoprotein-anchoring transpeptidase ErfK/SrfK